jgi:hypothetical protein
MIIKFNPMGIYINIVNWATGEYRLSTWQIELINKKPGLYGYVTLSLKVGKKRKLVKGFVRYEKEQNTNLVAYWFRPNNREKLLTLMSKVYTYVARSVATHVLSDC